MSYKKRGRKRNVKTKSGSLDGSSNVYGSEVMQELALENQRILSELEEVKARLGILYSLKDRYIESVNKYNDLVTIANQSISDYQRVLNTISYRFGNAIIGKKKNNDNWLAVIRKLIKLRVDVKAGKKGRKPRLIAFELISQEVSSITNHFSISNIKIVGDSGEVIVTKDPVWISIAVIQSTRVHLSIEFVDVDERIFKNSLARVRYFNEAGEEVKAVDKQLSFSPSVGNYQYFQYVNDSEKMEITLAPPKGACYVRVGVQAWGACSSFKIVNNIESKSELVVPQEEPPRKNKEFGLLKEGVSIIVPSYKGVDTIDEMLDSVSKQTLPKKLMQLVIVINGGEFGVKRKVQLFRKQNPLIDVVIMSSPVGNASDARNKGIVLADRQYLVFLDNDDLITPNYLLSLYELADPDSICFSGIYDLDQHGILNKDNAINLQYLSSLSDDKLNVFKLTSLTTMIACKILPTNLVKTIEFDTSLRSGEDVAYFSEYIAKVNPQVKVVSSDCEAYYIRRLRDNSVSRQSTTYDFNVYQRLQVIANLSKVLEDLDDGPLRQFVKSKMDAQAGFIKRYLDIYPEEKMRVVESVREFRISDFPYNVVNKGMAETLVISYCFPPYVDTSSAVMAKRVRRLGEVVDVVYNDMSTVRKTSVDLNLLVDDLTENKILIRTPSAFGRWEGIEKFYTECIQWFESQSYKYKKIYSRAMWPASHFAGFHYKKNAPAVKWIAEFSDPILKDIDSKERYEKLPQSFVISVLETLSYDQRASISEFVDSDNMYLWCELIPFLFADEIIFTCENQRTYMLSTYSDKLKVYVTNKSIISSHPTLTSEFYSLVEGSYSLNKDKVNIGYFGAFYSKRNLECLLDAMKLAKKRGELGSILLHVFTQQKEDAVSFVEAEGLSPWIIVNDYLSYLEFLSSLKEFDCLVVNDAEVAELKGLNPYLPSKVSDYLGSGVKVWAIVEEGSALSGLESVHLKSYYSDTNGVYEILAGLAIP